MYSGGCLLIDHSSGYMSIKHQVDINANETVKSNLTIEGEGKSQVLMINVYHTYNGIINTSKYMEELLNNQQNVRFSGASSSYQNGAAERNIKKVFTMSSAILMQAWMIYHNDTLSIDFGQLKWTMMYGS